MPVILLTFAVLAILAVRLLDHFYIPGVLAYLTPHYDIIARDTLLGKHNVMGLNTTLMLALLCCSTLLRIQRKATASQLFAFAALSIPSISLTGYAYGITYFFGEMSLFTTTFGLVLSLSALLITANRGAMRAMLSPYIGGKLARYQIIASFTFCFGIGYLIVNALTGIDGDSIFGAYVVAVCWFIVILVATSSIVQERVDKRRRIAEKQLMLAAATDPLTGLFNRRALKQEATMAMARLKRHQGQMYLLLIDIDYFKKINDQYGHPMGDKVLVQLASLLKSLSRLTDTVSRIGGEEFVILLPDTNQAGALKVAETLRIRVSCMDIPELTDSYGPLTISIGCAEYTQDMSFNRAIENADNALYKAKNNGRNCTIIDTSEV
jgi:diguanylate cyclase (GGDEF)-like protein